MFLKRLDIIGFKSFAERIGIDFVPGVTAVVGPNGSGKSNITDAIRWVLGEQSVKSLRGGKMEDIIFSGSDSRKPLNFAEVTLTLQNDDQFLPIDYHEVSITRRVFRTGESEFFINKQACRLRDIVELFMDSGLGKEAFSIIGQGKVEQILNSKAEERRTIFEEAAGVLKYKTRKRQAEAKLGETEENLNRVRDIVYELESQVGPLKEQATVATEYLEKKEALEQVEVALTVVEIEQLHARWETLSKQLTEHTDHDVELATVIQKQEAKISEMRQQMASLDDLISQLQAVLLRASEEHEKLEGQRDVLKERKRNSAQNKEQLIATIAELNKRVHSLKEQKGKLKEISNELTSDIAQLRAHLQKNEHKRDLLNGNLEAEIDSLKSDYIELLNGKASTNNELAHIQRQLEQSEIRLTQLEKENEKYLHTRQDIEQEKEAALKQLHACEQQLEEQMGHFRKEQQKLVVLHEQYEKLGGKYDQANRLFQQMKSRKDVLEEMEEDFAGFYQGVKQVLRARNRHLAGIHGAVAELIQVPKKYETAIEIALGGAMQHVVVAEEQDARRAIQYLKERKYGRATFLPLSIIKERQLSRMQQQIIEQHPSFIGVAASLVSYDVAYEAVISNLLGTVIVTKDLKGANEMARELQFRCRFVTLDGSVVNPGGSMTGGALKQKTTSLISRKVELEEMRQQIVDREQEVAQFAHAAELKKEEIQEQNRFLDSIRTEGEGLRLQQQKLMSDVREVELREKNINERLAIYDMEAAQTMKDKEQLTKRGQQLMGNLSVTKEKIAELDEKIHQLTEQKNNEVSSKEKLVAENSDLKVQLTVKEETLAHQLQRMEEVVLELKDRENRVAMHQTELELLLQEMTDHTSNEKRLQVEALQKWQDKQATTQLISERRSERFQLQQKLEDMEQETKEYRRLHKETLQDVRDEEIKLNRLDVQLNNKLDHLREEYLLTYEGAKEQYPLKITVEEAREQVKATKQAIERLGTVNLGAIDEYERVSERYEFLLEQQNDLETAKETLYQVIAEMDEEMKKRFEQTFSEVRLHFEPVFQSLFGGGRADLLLTDETDLLNTGVDIIAQPPGKKLQNLALLSGGERALTAIALLFAILKVRVVPFCVLDEVEAALDEANVQRFSEYLKQFSSETQFIVITHRKGTMEEADVLYGVTMQESGVSKLVSVRLEDTEKLAQ